MSDEDDASAKFQAKYGDVRPKPRLIASDVKHFDSADWAMRQSLDRARESAGAGGERRERDERREREDGE